MNLEESWVHALSTLAMVLKAPSCTVAGGIAGPERPASGWAAAAPGAGWDAAEGGAGAGSAPAGVAGGAVSGSGGAAMDLLSIRMRASWDQEPVGYLARYC